MQKATSTRIRRAAMLPLVTATLTGTLLATSGPASAAIDENLNNANPTQIQPFFVNGGFEPYTTSNMTPQIVGRGYGRCVFASGRYDVAVHDAAVKGSVLASARVVVDNGSCTGPNVNTSITVSTTPIYIRPNFTLKPFTNCTKQQTGTGAVTAWIMTPDCAPDVTFGPNGVFTAKINTGWYSQHFYVGTGEGFATAFDMSPAHAMYQ